MKENNTREPLTSVVSVNEARGNREVVSYPKAMKNLYSVMGPFCFSKIVEAIVDYATFALLSEVNSNYSAASALITSSTALIRGISAGCLYYTSMLVVDAQRNRDFVRAGLTQRLSWLFANLLSVPWIVFAGFSGFRAFFALISQPTEPARIAQNFLFIYCLGLPFLLMSVSCQQFVLGIHKPKLVLITPVVRSVFLFFSYAAIYGKFGFPDGKEFGAGIAVSASYFFNFLFFALTLKFDCSFDPYKIFAVNFRGGGSDFKRLVEKGAHIGLDIFTELFSISFTVYMIGKSGKVYLSALQPSMQYAALITVTTFAVGTSGSIIIRRAVGEEKYNDVKRYIASITGVNLLLPLSCCVAYGISHSLLALPFLSSEDRQDHSVLENAENFLLIGLLGGAVNSIRNSLDGTLKGFDETAFPMLANVFATLLINVALGLFLAYGEDAPPYQLLLVRQCAIAVCASLTFGKMVSIMHNLQQSNSCQRGCLKTCASLFFNQESRQVAGENEHQDNYFTQP